MSDAEGAAPVVSIVVVNHDGAGQIEACLSSLLASIDTPFEMFAVDNDSSDDSLERMRALASKHPRLEVVANAENVGYAGALNRVLPRCRGRYIGLFNMDVVAEPGWLEPMVRCLETTPAVAAVNPLLLLADGEHVNATGLDLHVSGLAFNRDLGRARREIRPEPFVVGGVQGAAFLIRRDVLERVGGLDERGFLYHEDVWLSWALRSMGLAVMCTPASVLRHDYHLSMHPEKLYLLERNRWWLLATALGPWMRFWLQPFFLATETMLLCYAVMRGPRFVTAKLRAMRDALHGRAQTRSARADWIARRSVSERELIRGLDRRYAWRQFARLAGERGEPRRPFVAPEADRS